MSTTTDDRTTKTEQTVPFARLHARMIRSAFVAEPELGDDEAAGDESLVEDLAPRLA